MRFRNPVNGHIEERAAPWLWTLLFGGLYFIAAGLWAPLLIWMVLTVGLYAAMGAPATLLVLIMNIIYAALSAGLVRSSYLRKGWAELADGDTGIEVRDSVAMRKCPFCAEDIRAEAIKCKHCGSVVDPVMMTAVESVEPSPVLTVAPPPGVVVTDHIANILGRYGATSSALGYVWRGDEYPSFAALVDAINRINPALTDAAKPG